MLQLKDEASKLRLKNEEIMKIFDALKKSMRMSKVVELENRNSELEQENSKLKQLEKFNRVNIIDQQ